jgi:hypothetical protein
MVLTASTSSSGPILSMAVTTAPFTLSVIGPLFSYGMPSSGTSPVLSYSTLQPLGLGAGSSNAHLQGHMGGTSAPFNAFPYGEVIYLLPPLHSVAPTSNPSGHPHTIVFLDQGVKDHLLIINNAFSLSSFPNWGQPWLRTTYSYAGYYSCTGGTPKNFFHINTLEFLAGISSLVRNAKLGKFFSQPMEPRKRYYAYAHGIGMGKPFPKSSECNACPAIYILFWQSVDDVSSHTESIRWSWP